MLLKDLVEGMERGRKDAYNPDWEEENADADQNHPAFKRPVGKVDTKEQLIKNATRTVDRRNK